MNRSCGSVWKWDWSRARTYRWTAASWKPTLRKKAAFHASNWGEAAQVHHTVRQYLQELRQQNPVEEPVHQQEQVSTTDPDSTYVTQGAAPRHGWGTTDNYLVDNDSCVIVGVQATAARMSQETVAAQDMLTRFAQWRGREPDSIAADTTYGNGEFLQWLTERRITPYMWTRDSIRRKRYRYLAIHTYESARQHARELANTAEFAQAHWQRKKLEALFAELKNQIGLRRLRLRRLKFVREQFFNFSLRKLSAASDEIDN